MELENKIAIITGSAQGLGRVFARNLLKEGARVCISDVNEDVGEKTKLELTEEFGKEKVHFIQCDVTKEDDLKQLYDGCEEYFNGSVDIFCNNAGINHARGWRLCMDIDIMAVMAATELAFAKMDIRRGGKGGIILNTASIAGLMPGMSIEHTPYFVAKGAVVTLTRSLGQDKILKSTGVKVQCVCPHFADTNLLVDFFPGGRDFLAKAFGTPMTPEFVVDGFLKTLKYGRNGAAVVIQKDAPPFEIGIVPAAVLRLLGHWAKMMNQLFGYSYLQQSHQIMSVAISVLFFIFTIILLFSVL